MPSPGPRSARRAGARHQRLRPSPAVADGLGDVLAVVVADPPADRDGDHPFGYLVQAWQPGMGLRDDAVDVVSLVDLAHHDALLGHPCLEFRPALDQHGVEPAGRLSATCPLCQLCLLYTSPSPRD